MDARNTKSLAGIRRENACTCTRANTHTHTHTHTYAQLRTQIHTHTHTHTLKRTHALGLKQPTAAKIYRTCAKIDCHIVTNAYSPKHVRIERMSTVG